MAWVASLLVDYPFYLLLLSWAPGSVETMSFAALMLKADAGFVMANHLVRMLLIHTLPALAIYRQSRQSQKLSKRHGGYSRELMARVKYPEKWSFGFKVSVLVGKSG